MITKVIKKFEKSKASLSPTHSRGSKLKPSIKYTAPIKNKEPTKLSIKCLKLKSRNDLNIEKKQSSCIDATMTILANAEKAKSRIRDRSEVISFWGKVENFFNPFKCGDN